MKKLILTFIFAVFFALPVYADTIITVPIDGRPISNEYLSNLAEIGNDRYISVSKENLDFFSSYEPDNHLGKSDKVREELYNIVSQNNNEHTTVIINTSSYITNGLVGSRCGINYENYKTALNDMEKLITDFDKPVYYVNLSMPRSLPETRFNKIWPDDKNMRGLGYYYLKYNKESEDYDEISKKFGEVTPAQYIMEFSYVSNKAAELGENKLTDWERAFLNYFNNNVKTKAPYKQYVDYYIRPYESAAAIFERLLSLEKAGKLSQIVISNDDLQLPDSITYFYNKGCDWVQEENDSPVKYSYARTYMETGTYSVHRSIINAYSKQELGRANTGAGKFINIIYGTDEVPQLIYARDYARRKYMTARMSFVYNDANQNVAAFDVKKPGNIARSAYAFVKGDVGKYTENPTSIYVYDYRLKTDKTASAIDSLKREKKSGSNIGLIELFNGTAENKIFQNILYNRKGLSLSDLDMYSAWNTNGNAIGLGVAHAQVISIAKEITSRPGEMLLAQAKVVAQHAIEDGIYTKSGKLTLNNRGYRPNVQDRINSQTLYDLMDVNKITSELCRNYSIKGEEYTIDELKVNKLSFPWGRTFDIYVGVEGKASKVK
ncbi:MAG: DUF4127 family protein [Clostridia bacterium]|nr:DUF4127 family protein [Clostridia bacterium]